MIISKAKEYLPFVQALAEGKTIQHRNQDEWYDLKDGYETYFSAPPENYRIKPTPTLRPWKPEEVPIGAWLRSKSADDFRALMLSVDSYSIKTCSQGGASLYAHSFTDALKYREHSLDHGITWKPCGVVE